MTVGYEQLLAHFLGDYVLQPHKMAMMKVEKLWMAFLHGAIYTACFVPFTGSWVALLVIWVSHSIQDHFYWRFLKTRPEEALKGFPFWKAVVTDHTLHLIVNYLAIRML